MVKSKFSENGLTALPDNAFEGLKKLKTLDLRDNSIYHIDRMAFNSLGYLEKVYLQGNKLYHLQYDWVFCKLFKKMKAVIYTSLDLVASNFAKKWCD